MLFCYVVRHMRNSDVETLALIGIGIAVGVIVAPVIPKIRMRHIKFANKVILPIIKEVLEKA